MNLFKAGQLKALTDVLDRVNDHRLILKISGQLFDYNICPEAILYELEEIVKGMIKDVKKY